MEAKLEKKLETEHLLFSHQVGRIIQIQIKLLANSSVICYVPLMLKMAPLHVNNDSTGWTTVFWTTKKWFSVVSWHWNKSWQKLFCLASLWELECVTGGKRKNLFLQKCSNQDIIFTQLHLLILWKLLTCQFALGFLVLLITSPSVVDVCVFAKKAARQQLIM